MRAASILFITAADGVGCLYTLLALVSVCLLSYKRPRESEVLTAALACLFLMSVDRLFICLLEIVLSTLENDSLVHSEMIVFCY